MSASYSRPSASTRDFVRFLIRDIDVGNAMLEDEEIDDVIATETSTGAALKYFAAATCLETLHTAWMSKGKGVSSRKVSRLTVVYGTGAGINIDAAIQERIKSLRIQGARLLSPSPYAIRCLAH